MPTPPPGPRTKAIGIDWLRGVVDTRGEVARQQLSRALGEADGEVFRHVLAVTWIPEETALRIYEASGRILFPGREVLFEVGREMAKANMTTIYKAFIRVATVSYVLSQAARLWGTYHDTGKAAASKVAGASEVVFVVTEFPSCPAGMREVLRGYIAGLAELVGIRKPVVVHDGSRPSAWKWTVTWS